MSRWLFSFFVLIPLSINSTSVVAEAPRTDDKNSAAKTAKRASTKPTKTTRTQKPKTRALRKMTPARQAAAVTFAQTHHPELHELLTNLKRTNRREFDKAVRELFNTSERLARFEERDPERYEFQLQAWKLDSRIRLLAARMTMTDDPALEAELKSALIERNQIRLQIMILDRNRLQQRVDQLNRNIEKFQQHPATTADREFEKLKKSLGAYTSKSKKRNRRKPKATTSPRTVKPKPQTTKNIDSK